MILCRLCQTPKTSDHFSASGVKRRECRPCSHEKKRKWERDNRPQHLAGKRRSQLRVLYGITPAEVDALLAGQDGRCGICGTTNPAGRWGTWHVDHNHVTGQVRGLLCFQCNRRLGELENHGWRELADRYLDRTDKP